MSFDDTVDLPESIKFTDSHVEKIRKGDKIATLRTVKKGNVPNLSKHITVEGTDLELVVYGSHLVYLDERFLLNLGKKSIYDKQRVADMEGFDSWTDLINWFQNRNYNLPQPFLWYHFYVK